MAKQICERSPILDGSRSKNSYVTMCYNVIMRENRPLRAKEIVDIALRENMMPDHIYGKTQNKTVQARLSEHISRYGKESLFYRVSPGLFYIRDLKNTTEFPLLKQASKKPVNVSTMVLTVAELKNIPSACLNFSFDHEPIEKTYPLSFSVIITCNNDILYNATKKPFKKEGFIKMSSIDLIDGVFFPATRSALECITTEFKVRDGICFDNFKTVGLLKDNLQGEEGIFFLIRCDITFGMRHALTETLPENFFWKHIKDLSNKYFKKRSFINSYLERNV